MKRIIILIILICGICVICGSGWSDLTADARRQAGEKKLNVLTTTSDLKSITEEVGGKYVSVKSVCEGYQDPHFAEAKPSMIANARKADLFIRIGLELEVGYEPLIIEGARNPKIHIGTDGHLDASDGVSLLEVPTAKVDRSMGDVHPFGNPHYWLDPYNARIMARNISGRLQKIDPTHSTWYQANYQVFIKKIDEAMFGVEASAKISGDKLWDAEISGKLDDLVKQENVALGGWVEKARHLRGMKMVMFHRSWTYFINRFRLIAVGEIEPKPGIPPGPAHLRDLIQKVKSENAKVILTEPFYDRKSSDFVAAQTGASVAVCALSVNGKPEVKDYISLIDYLMDHLLQIK
ncbi:MAG: metal ABC transporter substrate-binding protein [Planctomycetota bacterium]